MKTGVKSVIVALALVLMNALVFAGGQGEKGEKVTIEHFDQKGGNEKAIQTVADMFMKANPNITVKVSTPPDAETVIMSRLSSKDFPDVISHWADTRYRAYVKEGYLLDLSKEKFITRVMPAFLDLTKLDGKYYCVPLAANLFGFIYNTAVFKENNLAIPNTWAELIGLLKTMKSKGLVPIAFADGASWTLGHQTADFYPNVLPNWRKTLEKIHKGELDVQDVPEFRTIGEMLLELRSYGQRDPMGADHIQAVADFTAGKAVMILNGNWMMPTIRDSMPKDFQFSMFPIPFDDPKKTVMLSGMDWVLSAMSSTKHPQAALKYLEFLTTVEADKTYCELSDSPPAIQGVTVNIPAFGLCATYLAKGQITDFEYQYPELTPYWQGSMMENDYMTAQNLMATRDIDGWLKDLNKLFQTGWKQ